VDQNFRTCAASNACDNTKNENTEKKNSVDNFLGERVRHALLAERPRAMTSLTKQLVNALFSFLFVLFKVPPLSLCIP